MILRITSRRELETFLEKRCERRAPGPRASRLRVYAPASIANIGPGFDVLAVALEGVYDVLEIEFSPEGSEVVLEVYGLDIPREENIVYRISEVFHERCGGGLLRLRLFKGVPVSRGLGSSGASSVAVAMGLSEIYSLGLSRQEIVSIAGYGEALVAGEPHYDNVAASCLGGLVVIDQEKWSVIRVPVDIEVWFTVLIPEVSVPENKTLYARSILPTHIERGYVVRQVSSAVKAVLGVVRRDPRTFGEAVSTDYIAEPYRSKLIPYYEDLKKISLERGALGFNISGAGPSVFAVTETREDASRIGSLLVEYLRERGYSSRYLVARIDNRGAYTEVF